MSKGRPAAMAALVLALAAGCGQPSGGNAAAPSPAASASRAAVRCEPVICTHGRPGQPCTAAGLTGQIVAAPNKLVCNPSPGTSSSASAVPPPSTPPGQGSGPAGYLTTGPANTAFLQWQDTGGGHLEGTFTGAAESGTPPYASVSGSSIPLSGTMSGSTVTLTFTVPGFFGSAQRQVIGTLNGGTLTLQITQADGMIKDLTFVQGDTSSYNSAVAALREKVRRANSGG